MKKIKVFDACHLTSRKVGLQENMYKLLDDAVNEFVVTLKNKNYSFLQSESNYGITFTVIYEE